MITLSTVIPFFIDIPHFLIYVSCNGLQTEEHIFWDCKRYEEQRATMRDILSENSKKECPKSVSELLRLEENKFVQGVCYFIKYMYKVLSPVGGGVVRVTEITLSRSDD
jgi:hypothetical protein